MSDLQGMVRAVVTTEHGGVAVSWVGNTLTVTDGADFPRDGGQFIVEGDPTTVYSYSLVTDGETEDDPDIITTVDPAPAGLPAGDEFRLTLWPVAVSSVAEVALPEAVDDTVPAIIPHALKPYLVDGVRDPEAQEAVIIGQRDMAWVVVDILDQPEVVMAEVVQAMDAAAVKIAEASAAAAEARADAEAAHGLASAATQDAQDAHNAAVDAQDTAAAAATAAGAAQTTATNAAQVAADAAGLATSKADVFIQSTAPAAAYQKATTLWIDTTGGTNKPKRWDGSKWVTVTDKAATDAAAAAAAAQTAATNAATAAQAAQDEAEDALAAAATAQYTVDNLQVGGRNLLLDSAGGIPYHSGGTYMWVQGVETPFGVHDVVQYTATGAASLIRKSGVVQPNVEYTFSFWAKAANAGETAKVAIDIADVAQAAIPLVTVGDEWVHISTTATYTGSNPAVYNFVDAAVRTVGVPVYIALWKLERGNKATDWTPAPEDVDAAIAGKVTTFYGTTTPTATATGDMWIDTTTNRLKRWNGSTWADVTDPVLQKALTAAGDAHAAADGKVRTFAQNEPPTGMVEGDVGDLWVDTNDGNKLHRYSGSKWEAVQDASIATAKAAADTAAQAAANAAGIAGGKADVLIQSTAPSAAMQKATTLWIDTTGGTNKPKRWDGSKWVVVTDKAATDAATAAANAQTTANNAATAAANAKTAADNAAAAAAAAQTAASNAQTTATNALTSANGRNSRVTSTSAPSGTTNPNTGLAWVDGDTWWQWDSTTAKNVIGAWTRRAGKWEAEKIGHETIASVDVNTLLVTGSARMTQAVVDKIIGDAAFFKLLTAERLAVAPPTNMLAGIERWSTPGANASDKPWRNFGHNTNDPSMWYQGNGAPVVEQELEFTAGVRYRFEVDVRASVPDTRFYWELRRTADDTRTTWGDLSGSANANPSTDYPFRSALVTGTGWNTYWSECTALESGVVRLRIYANHSTGAANPDGYQWFRNPRIRPMVSGVLIEDGAVTSDKITAGAITGKTITGGTITGTVINGATINGGLINMTSGGASVTIGEGSIASVDFAYSGNKKGEILAGANYVAMNGPDIVGLNAGSNLQAHAENVGVFAARGHVYVAAGATSAPNIANAPTQLVMSNGTLYVQRAASTPRVFEATSSGTWVRYGTTTLALASGLTAATGGGHITLDVRDATTHTGQIQLYTSNGGITATTGAGAINIASATGTATFSSQSRVDISGPGGSLIRLNGGGIYQTSTWQQFTIGSAEANYNTWAIRPISLSGVTRAVLQFGGGGANMPQTTIAANVLIDANGNFYRTSSARRFKNDIQDVGVDPRKLLDVPVRDWIDATQQAMRDEAELKRSRARSAKTRAEADALLAECPKPRRTPGVVAEEVEAAGLGMFVTYDGDGKTAGVMYDRLPLLLIPLVADLRARVERLENPT